MTRGRPTGEKSTLTKEGGAATEKSVTKRMTRGRQTAETSLQPTEKGGADAEKSVTKAAGDKMPRGRPTAKKTPAEEGGVEKRSKKRKRAKKKAAAKNRPVAETDDAETKPKKRKRVKRRTQTYKRYIHKVLKEVDSKLTLSTRGMSVINSFVTDVMERLAQEASRLAKYNKKSTMAAREIQAAVKLVLPKGLAECAIEEGNKAFTKFKSA